MTTVVTLNESVAQRLRVKAAAANRSIDDVANQLLTQCLPSVESSAAAASAASAELAQLVQRIRSRGPNPAMIRPAQRSLAGNILLPGEQDVPFDEAAWNREWAKIEEEMDALEIADQAAASPSGGH